MTTKFYGFSVETTLGLETRTPVEVAIDPGDDVTFGNTRGAPYLVAAAVGIPAPSSSRTFLFVAGSGGPVVVTANPRIGAGTAAGQELILKGTSDVDSVELANGQGLELNGACVLKNGSLLRLLWDGTIWGEVARNDI